MTVCQAEFAAALLDPEAPVPPGLTDPEGRPAPKRFAVYRNNVAVSLGEALETAFPVLQKLVGEQNFRVIAGLYLRKHPPSSPLMMFYGQDMPRFLEGFAPAQSLPYLPDVARLELAVRESYHAADAAPIEPSVLEALAPEALMAARFALAPAVRLIRSEWPVASIWRRNMIDGASKPGVTAEDTLVTRHAFDPEVHALPAGGGTFVARLAEKRCLGDAFEAATAANPEFDLTATLSLLLGGGALTAILEGPTL